MYKVQVGEKPISEGLRQAIIARYRKSEVSNPTPGIIDVVAGSEPGHIILKATMGEGIFRFMDDGSFIIVYLPSGDIKRFLRENYLRDVEYGQSLDEDP